MTTSLTTTKFKVGDRVRRIKNPVTGQAIGWEGVVTAVKDTGNPNTNVQYLFFDNNLVYMYFDSSYELVEGKKPVPLSDRSDEELAAALRKASAKLAEIRGELQGRGYVIEYKAGSMSSFVINRNTGITEFRITKTVTTVKEL